MIPAGKCLELQEVTHFLYHHLVWNFNYPPCQMLETASQCPVCWGSVVQGVRNIYIYFLSLSFYYYVWWKDICLAGIEREE